MRHTLMEKVRALELLAANWRGEALQLKAVLLQNNIPFDSRVAESNREVMAQIYPMSASPERGRRSEEMRGAQSADEASVDDSKLALAERIRRKKALGTTPPLQFSDSL